jgi:hypothetical protein
LRQRTRDGGGTLHSAFNLLRNAVWLNAARFQGCCVVLAFFAAVLLVNAVISAPSGMEASGHLLAPDFVTFYGASSFLPGGHAASVYDHAAFAARLQALFPHGKPGDYAFLYPPGFLFLCLGLSALPYMAALVLWQSATLLALLAALRRLVPRRFGLLATLAYPAMLMNAANGQNAFATGACFAAALACGDGAPIRAGLCLGLLAIKPQLGLLVPVGLALGGRWRSFAAAGATALAVCALAGLMFGMASWRAWVAASPLSRVILEHGYNGYQNMLSLFAAVRLLHGGVGLAYAAQAIAAAVALIVMARVVRPRVSLRAAIALTAVATLVATPWSLDYDLVVLAGPLAWAAGEALRGGWLPWEKITLLAAYLLPLLSRNVAADTGVDPAPMILLALLLVVARRAAATAIHRQPGSTTGSVSAP